MNTSKEIEKLLRSIDVSLQIIASRNSSNKTTAFVDKKTVASVLGVPLVTIDKLIHQGLVSNGQSGLVHKRHYAKLDPTESNTSNFLYDAGKILEDAWNSFKDYDNQKQ